MASDDLTDLEQRFIDAVDVASRLCGVSQTDIGTAIGVTNAQVSQRQSGKTRYSLRDMHHIGVLFGVDPLCMAAGLSAGWMDHLNRDDVQARARALAKGAGRLHVPSQPIAPTG